MIPQSLFTKKMYFESRITMLHRITNQHTTLKPGRLT